MQREQARFLGKPVAGDRALIMAIVNRTPDSFYDRGATFTDEAAKRAVNRVIAEGAPSRQQHRRKGLVDLLFAETFRHQPVGQLGSLFAHPVNLA